MGLKMKKEYIAVILGGFIAAMATSGASYIGASQNLAVNTQRIDTIELTQQGFSEVHKETNKTLKELTIINTQMQIALARISTVIEIKLGDKNAEVRSHD